MVNEVKSEPIRYPDGSGRSLAEIVDSLPAATEIELAPGRYTGPLVITRPMSIRGAGDLSRLAGSGRAPVITVRVPDRGEVVIESVLIHDGDSATGGGIRIESGLVRLHNIQIQRCRSDRGSGGAIHVAGGEVEAERIRAHDLAADKGGAIFATGRAIVKISDSEIRKSEARVGGAIAVEEAAQLSIESITIGKVRATTSSGGQAIWVCGGADLRPNVALRRVRLEDAPMGMPLFVDPHHPGDVVIAGCDMPRVVLMAQGVVDGGQNRWR